MRIIKPATLVAYAEHHPSATSSLLRWMETATKAKWRTFTDVRKDLPHADMVRVGSLKPVVVFNIAGNKFRLITAIHFDKDRLFVLDFLTHAEYSKELGNTGSSPAVMPRDLAKPTDELPNTIAGLWTLCALTPLRTRTAYEEASSLCGKLAVRRLSAAQREYFRELLALVEAYEDTHGEKSKALTKLRALAKHQ